MKWFSTFVVWQNIPFLFPPSVQQEMQATAGLQVLESCLQFHLITTDAVPDVTMLVQECASAVLFRLFHPLYFSHSSSGM